MAIVELSDQEWTTVMALMAYAPGRDCLPYLNKIGAQLQAQQQNPSTSISHAGIKIDNPAGIRGNSQEKAS